MEQEAASGEVRIGIVVETDVAQEVLQRYWAGTIDKFGRAHYDESIASIADDLGIGVPDVTRLAKATGYGYRPRWRCHLCNGVWPLRTRSDGGPQNRRCNRCHAEAAEAVAAGRAATASLRARRAGLLSKHLGRGQEEERVRVDLGEITALPLRDVIALAAWTSSAGADGVLPPTSEDPVGVFADPETARHLMDLGLVRLDPSSSLDAFAWVDDRTSLQASVNPAAARFHLPGAGPIADRTMLAVHELFDALCAPWPRHWVDSAVETTQRCLIGEVVRRMTGLLRKHHMAAPTTDQHDRLRKTAQIAVESFTLGECFTMTMGGAKTASSAKLQRPRMSAAAVTGSAIDGVATYLGNALNGDWTVFEYDRRADAPPSLETETLAVVLGLNPMTMSLADAKGAAEQLVRPGALGG